MSTSLVTLPPSGVPAVSEAPHLRIEDVDEVAWNCGCELAYAELSISRGDARSALDHYRRYVELKDSIVEEEHRRRFEAWWGSSMREAAPREIAIRLLREESRRSVREFHRRQVELIIERMTWKLDKVDALLNVIDALARDSVDGDRPVLQSLARRLWRNCRFERDWRKLEEHSVAIDPEVRRALGIEAVHRRNRSYRAAMLLALGIDKATTQRLAGCSRHMVARLKQVLDQTEAKKE